MYRFQNQLALLLALLTLLGLTACGTSQTAPGTQTWHPNAQLAAAVPFPVDHATSVAAATTKTGIQDDQRSSHTTEFGNALELDATPTSTEFALYSFHPSNDPISAEVSVDDAHTTQYWIGVADYPANHWVFLGPFTTTHLVPESANNVSPLGNCFYAIVTPPDQTVRVESIKLTVNDIAPTASFTASAGGPAPVQIDFDASASTDADGTITAYDWDFENDGAYDDTGSTVSHVYAAAGTYTVKLRVTDNGGVSGSTTKDVVVTVATNQKPHAAVTASPNQAAPYMSTLDASTSSDPDGTIVKYEWDLDNDGIYEVDGGATPTKQFNVPAVGAYTIGLRVTDNTGGLGGQDTTTITVLGTGWKSFTFPITGDEVGRLNSLAVINGKPAIAMHVYDGAMVPARTIRYAYATTATGEDQADWQIITTPATSSGGQQISLAEVDGDPAIVVGDATNHLAYFRSSTPLGGSPGDWSGVKADSTATISGSSMCLAVISGNPAIAYQGQNTDTCYVRSSTVDGMSAADWSTPIIVDGATWDSGGQLSLAEIAGSPAIAYSDSQTGLHTKYARANNTTGTPDTAWTDAGSSNFVLDATTSYYGSLKDINGHPAVAYYRPGVDDLYYAIASTNSGNLLADWTLVAADITGSAGVSPGLALVAGKPAIISGDSVNSLLQFTHATTSTGGASADWPDSAVVDPGVVGGYYTSIAEVNGFAAISYYADAPDYKLHYAILFE